MTPEDVLSRHSRATARRRPLESTWQDCYDHALPAFGNAPLFDATAADAAEQLASSLLAELTPPWSRWFGLAPARHLPDALAAEMAAELELAADTLQGHLDRSNFALEIHQAFLDLVVAGTGVLMVEEAPPGEASALRFHAVPLRDAVMEEGVFVARHTAGAQDHLYEVAWASQGYAVEIDHTATATRLGGVVRAWHQALPHREATREIAAVPSLRAAAIRWNATETGFEKLACLSSNVAGSPSSIADFTFPALDALTLTNRGVTLTGGRALGFVVDARICRDFALSVDADAPRLMVMTFDASGALLTDAGGALVLASGQSMAWNADARWWQGAADMNDDGLTRLQAVRLAPQVATAIIGVVRVAQDYEVRAMRLSCDPRHAPAVLYGLPDLRHGVRELIAEQAWDPASIAAGGSAQTNVTVAGARPGDFVQAAFSLSTSGVVFMGQIGAQDTVTVTAWNRSGGAVDLNAGTVRVRVLKS